MKTIPICSVFVVNDRNEILAIKQKFHIFDEYFWTLPGGGIELGETPEQAAQRELFEETGYNAIGPAEKVYEYHVDTGSVLLEIYGFLYRAWEGEARIAEEDIIEIRFLPLDYAREHMTGIRDESRVAPIFKIFDYLQEGREIPCYRCRYTLDRDRSVIKCIDL